MSFDVVIVDASSIINFVKYYHRYYSSGEYKTIFNGLKDFLVEKIQSGKIILIDKVANELKSSMYDVFKEEVKDQIIDTLELFDEVQSLIKTYYLSENEKFYNDDQVKIDAEMEKFENTYADLFIVAHAKKLKAEGKKVLIISEEMPWKDKKLIPKIPYICKKDNENVFCRQLPFALFEHYKDELTFTLDIS